MINQTNLSQSQLIVSSLSDVPDPWEGLVAALLDDLEVAHLQPSERMMQLDVPVQSKLSPITKSQFMLGKPSFHLIESQGVICIRRILLEG
jgi:hypothetical protein